MTFKIGILKNSAIFTGKQLCQSFFSIKLNSFFYTTPLVTVSQLSATALLIWHSHKKLGNQT